MAAESDGKGSAGHRPPPQENADPVAWRIQASLDAASTSEKRVARALLSHYPFAGLEPAAELAVLSSTSAPTVVRYIAKLGFSSYREFQYTLRQELQQRDASPVALASRTTPSGISDAAARILHDALDKTFAATAPSEIREAVGMLADARYPVLSVGGRFSQVLAEYLDLHLRIMRPGTRIVSSRLDDLNHALIDIDKRTVCVVFDYRRYQAEIVEFARRARSQGARVILFSDPWLSPAAEFADCVLTASVDASSPFDTLVPAMAQVDAVVADVYAALGDKAAARVRKRDGDRAV